MIVVLDTGPLGMVSNPNKTEKIKRARQWFRDLARAGHRIVVPEIADYELRRELVRAGKVDGIERLDRLHLAAEFLPLTTAAMRQAAAFWAESRNRGQPTCDEKELDGDAILAAQAATMPSGGVEVVIATTNVGHLDQFVTARQWDEIA